MADLLKSHRAPFEKLRAGTENKENPFKPGFFKATEVTEKTENIIYVSNHRFTPINTVYKKIYKNSRTKTKGNTLHTKGLW